MIVWEVTNERSLKPSMDWPKSAIPGVGTSNLNDQGLAKRIAKVLRHHEASTPSECAIGAPWVSEAAWASKIKHRRRQLRRSAPLESPHEGCGSHLHSIAYLEASRAPQVTNL